MSAAKKQTRSSPGRAWMRGVVPWLLSFGGIVLILVVLVGVIGRFVLWPKLKDRILADYRIGPTQVVITPQPMWIATSDVRAEVFQNPTLDGPLSAMDDDLTDRIAEAFARHPWAAQRPRVTKQYGFVTVDLDYRKPVCMVQVPDGYQPVDAGGVLLPRVDFTSVETTRYPRLAPIETGPTMPPGYRWEDSRVIGGAEIAAAVGEVWQRMRLCYIEPSAGDPSIAASGGRSNGEASPGGFAGRLPERFFTLVAYPATPGGARGTRILWGYAPGANAIGELRVEDKVARLKQYFADNDDTLNGPNGAPQDLDVRRLRPAVRP